MALCIAGHAQTGDAPFALSDGERAWIAHHGAVQVVLTRDAEPYYSALPGDAAPQGFAIDLLNLMAERAGMALRYHSVDTVAEAAAALRSGQFDMTPLAAPSPERRQIVSFPGALLATEWVIARRRDVGDTSAQQQFGGRRLAVVDAQVPGDMVEKAYPGASLKRYRTASAAVLAVSSGEADLAVGWRHGVLFAIESQLLANVEVQPEPRSPRSFLGPAVSLTRPELHGILQKAMLSITPAERSAIARRWLPRGGAAHWGASSVALTPAEQDWVAVHGDIRVGFDAAFAPYAFGDALGRFDGLGADLLRLAARKVGLRIIEQRGASFAEVVRAARDGELDLVVGMARNAERLAAFDFVGPFSTAPTAMLMRVGDRRTWRLPDEMAADSRLGLLRDHFLLPQLRSRLPALKLSEYGTQQAVLQALDRGEVDAAIGNATVSGRLVGELFTGRLQFTGVLPDADSELYFGVSRRQPELARLLRLGYEAITPGENTELAHRWLSVSVQPGLRLTDVLRWVLPLALALLAVVAVLWYANRRLTAAHLREREARAQAEQAVAARGRFLAYLSHELRGTVGAVTAGAQLLIERDDPELRPRLLHSLQQAGEQMQGLLESTLAHERTLADGPRLQPSAQTLQDWWTRSLAPLVLAAERKGLVLRQRMPEGEAQLWFDGPQLSQVLGNLVHNAIQYTPTGEVQVIGDWDGLRLRLQVIDNGPGIPPEEQAQVFEPYRQGRAGATARLGAGLGLAICRQIVEAMAGSLTLASAGVGGCCFEVQVPIGLPPAVHDPPTGTGSA